MANKTKEEKLELAVILLSFACFILLLTSIMFCNLLNVANKQVADNKKFLPKFEKEFSFIMEHTQHIEGYHAPGYIYVEYMDSNESYHRWKEYQAWEVIDYLEKELDKAKQSKIKEVIVQRDDSKQFLQQRIDRLLYQVEDDQRVIKSLEERVGAQQ